MSTLRDIRKTDDFKKAAYQLHETLKPHSTLSLNQVQSALAKALGARSLEAFYAQADTPIAVNTPAPQGTGFPSEPYVLTTVVDGHLAVWCGDCTRGTTQPVIANDFNYTVSDDIEPACVFNRDAVFAVMSQKKAKALATYTPFPNVQAMRLQDACAPLFALLAARYSAPDTLDAAIRALNPSATLDCPALWFHAENWRDEVEEGHTSRGYADWVLSQLEMWLDDMRSWMF